MFLVNLKAYFGVVRPKQYTSFDTPLRFDALLIFSPCILISEILSSPNLVKHGSSMFIHYKGRKYFTCTPKSLHPRPTTKKEKKNLNLVKCKITLTLRGKKKKGTGNSRFNVVHLNRCKMFARLCNCSFKVSAFTMDVKKSRDSN